MNNDFRKLTLFGKTCSCLNFIIFQSTVKAVQTQTEKSISLLRQFMFCLAANIEYR